MKSFKQFVNEQEGGDGGIATNNASGGNIAGIGVGPQGEPPGIPFGGGRAYVSSKGTMKTQQKRGYRKKRRKEQQDIIPLLPASSIILAR